MSKAVHEPEPAAWILQTVAWSVLALIAKLPLCRVGLHDDCGCCSPGYCTRCGLRQADEARPCLARRVPAERWDGA